MSGVGLAEDGVEASTSGIMETTMMEGEEYFNPDEAGTWTQKEMSDQLCRICAKPNQYLIPIFEGEGIEHQLEPKIRKHLPIEVSESDDLPLQVCYQCASTLIAWNDLVIACVEADQKLRQMHAQEEEDDKEVELFDEPIHDSDDGEEPSQPSTSIDTLAPDMQSDTTSHPKRSPGKAKKPKLKMTLVKSPTAGPSGLKSPVKKLISAKPQDSVVTEASERCEDQMCEKLQSHKSMQPSSLEVIGDKVMQSGLSKVMSHLKEVSTNLTKVQIQSKNEDQTEFACSLCKKIINSSTNLRSHQEHRTSMTLEEKICSNCCTSKPQKTLADCDAFVSNLITAHDDGNKLNNQTGLYFCLTCTMGNITAKALANHEQCKVMAQKKRITKDKKRNTTDHRYSKKEPLVMNYLLNQEGKSIHIKCFMNKENQPETYLCSLCYGDAQMRMNEACDHVKLLIDSVLLSGVVGNKSSLLSREGLSNGNNLVRKKTRYLCVSCGKLYSKQAALVLHMQSHTVEPSPCPYCSKVFMNAAMLNAHLNIHDEFPYKCSQCSQTFLLEPLLKKHLAKKHNSKRTTSVATEHNSEQRASVAKKHNSKQTTSDSIFKCKHCKHFCNLKSDLDIHLKSHDFSCTVCDKNFLTWSALKSHNKVHISKKEEKVVCDKCGLEVRHLRALTIHLIRQHGESENKSFVCETCGAAFWQKHELDQHQTIHSEERPFACDLCDATFKRKKYVETHLRRVHDKFNGSLLDPCVTCGMKFNTKKAKSEHLKTHSSLLYICRICNKNLTSKIGLYLHHKYAHERNKDSLSSNLALKFVRRAKYEKQKSKIDEGHVYSCNMCDKAYKSKSSLYQHWANIHSNREYPCNVCGKVYTKAVSLYAHKHIHEKKEVSCPICFKVFHWQGPLRKHLTTHSDVRKYQCKYCEKSFTRKFLLDCHTRTHTGEKPYACTVCGTSFAQSGDRNRHQMRHNRT